MHCCVCVCICACCGDEVMSFNEICSNINSHQFNHIYIYIYTCAGADTHILIFCQTTNCFFYHHLIPHRDIYFANWLQKYVIQSAFVVLTTTFLPNKHMVFNVIHAILMSLNVMVNMVDIWRLASAPTRLLQSSSSKISTTFKTIVVFLFQIFQFILILLHSDCGN